LLKSVLTSLPVNALSFFKAPSGIISSIDSLLIKIFFGGRGVRMLGNSHGSIGKPFAYVRSMEGWGEADYGV
jgi:hypothetical protein